MAKRPRVPFHLPREGWPAAADPMAARRLIERVAAVSPAMARLTRRPAVTAMLTAIGGGSPYLSDLCVRENSTLRAFTALGADAVADAALDDVRALSPGIPRKELVEALRAAKRRIALITALADIGGIWTLDQVTGALSALAEAALDRAVAHLLHEGHAQGTLRLPAPRDPPTRCGFTILGMGKLGAHELNYSSDIDLVLLYDPAAGVYTGDAEAMGAWYARLARDLVSVMETRTADGYVFRVDLRLRPDPAATPPAVSLPAALTYYESLGQNWERAAMLKARPVAGDLAMGEAFLDAIRPFVWRRGLDFAAIADLHAMKQRIDAHKRHATNDGATTSTIAGRDIKLAPGGIREIEFLAQTLQLVWGGRDPRLRVRPTRAALAMLAETGHLSEDAARALAADYALLRRVEHRLQMVADRQTHAMPARADEMARFAAFMSYADAHALTASLTAAFASVRRHYAGVFDRVPMADPHAPAPLDFRGDGEPVETISALRALGYADPAHVVASVRAWQAGRLRALRSERARLLLDELLPMLLATLGRQPHPDVAFARFDALLARLPAGVQILSLFQRNLRLIDRIATVLGASPSLADHLANHPAALDGLLSVDAMTEAHPPYGAVLDARLTDARTLEDALLIVRRLVREEDFALSVATIEGRLTAIEAAEARSDLLDAAIAAIVPRTLADFITRNGHVPGGAMGVVLLGRAGARRMTAGSDLDLMLVFDMPDDAQDAVPAPGRDARPMPAAQWFVRASHAIVAALTSPGVDGPLYAVDMRLRPSGSKGPVAVSLASFRRYHAEDAWTWERMALTQARVVATPAPLRGAIEAAIATALARPDPPARVRADARAMRTRMDRELPPRGAWDVKLRPGGMIDIEFLAQVRRLTNESPPPEQPMLDAAWQLYFVLLSLLRTVVGRRVPTQLPPASAEVLLRVVAETPGLPVLPKPLDVAGLLASLDDLAVQVRAAFDRQTAADEPEGDAT